MKTIAPFSGALTTAHQFFSHPPTLPHGERHGVQDPSAQRVPVMPEANGNLKVTRHGASLFQPAR